ncbi:MAG: hypothetical protein J5959_08535 [Butyrivibrio sp.]|nr:hypothetical protein [Butyrivibrio sp.]
MEKRRGLRFSIRTKITIGIILLNVIICTVMGIAIYRVVQGSYVQNASENTLAISQIAARQLNGNLLNLLETGADNSYANTVMQADMAQVVSSANISAIYTACERNGDFVYLSRPASDGIVIGTAVEAEFKDYMNMLLDQRDMFQTKSRQLLKE